MNAAGAGAGGGRGGSILFISKGEAGPSTRYRALAYFDRLRSAGWEPSHAGPPRGMRGWLRIIALARRADAVILLRLLPLAPLHALLRSAARHLIFDLDDAVYHGDAPRPSSTRMRRFAALARSCDGVWAGNSHLQDEARRHNPNVLLLPTAVDPGKYAPAARRAGESIDLVWIGSRSTRKYLEEALPALEAAAERIPGLRLKVIADFELPRGRLQTVCIPWSEATEAGDIAAAHIGIAPMPDNPWTRGKCGLKVLQYMAAGLPVVASEVAVHTSLVEPGVTGFLAAGARDWSLAIERLAADAGLRESFGAAGRRRVEQEFSTVVVGARLLAGLQGIHRGGRYGSTAG